MGSAQKCFERSMKLIEKPSDGEYAPDTIKYIGLLPDDGLVLKHLADNRQATAGFILSLAAEKLTYRYAEGKWTIKEILVHIVDDERIYSYRALPLLVMTKPNCPVLSRTITLVIPVRMSAILMTSWRNTLRRGPPRSLCSPALIVWRCCEPVWPTAKS
jgi:hypothetical protein